MADYEKLSLTWLGGDKVKVTTVGGNISRSLFSTQISADGAQGVVKMDQKRYEYETKKIKNTGSLSKHTRLEKDAYYRRKDGSNFQYSVGIHSKIMDALENFKHLMKTGIQGIRVGENKSRPERTIGIKHSNGYKNFLLLFTSDTLFAVVDDKIEKFPYEKTRDAEYSFGWTKKRISFDSEGERHHVWIYNVDKDDVKSAVTMLNSK